jgi:hypothetical protein
LDAAETAQFLGSLERRLGSLRATVSAGVVKWLREVPEGGNVRAKIVGWLTGLPDRIEVAPSARVG